jgi:hypothetical protein
LDEGGFLEWIGNGGFLSKIRFMDIRSFAGIDMDSTKIQPNGCDPASETVSKLGNLRFLHFSCIAKRRDIRLGWPG